MNAAYTLVKQLVDGRTSSRDKRASGEEPIINTHMAFQRKWSELQQRAVVDAQLIYGMSARQAHNAAHAGSLPGVGIDLEPFEIPFATLQEYATQARQEQRVRERARSTPGQVLSDVAVDMGMMLRKDIERLQKKQRKGAIVATELGSLARAAMELAKLQKAIQEPASTAAQHGNKDKTKPDGQDFITQLASREAGAQKKPRHRTQENQNQDVEHQRSSEEPQTQAESAAGRRAAATSAV